MSDAQTAQAGVREQEAGGPNGPLVVIQAEQAVHGAMLRRIIQLLMTEPEQEGMDLAGMLERLIGEIVRNTTAVNLLSEKVTAFGQEMPDRIVEAIGESLDPDRSPTPYARRES